MEVLEYRHKNNPWRLDPVFLYRTLHFAVQNYGPQSPQAVNYDYISEPPYWIYFHFPLGIHSVLIMMAGPKVITHFYAQLS